MRKNYDKVTGKLIRHMYVEESVLMCTFRALQCSFVLQLWIMFSGLNLCDDFF